MGRLPLLCIPKTSSSLHFLGNNSAGRSLLLYIPETSIYFCYFSQKRSFYEYCRSGPRILDDWCGKTTLRNDMSNIIIYIVYIGVVPGPEKMNDTCRKTMHTGTVDLLYLHNTNYIFTAFFEN
jgi:hypothetical protein